MPSSDQLGLATSLLLCCLFLLTCILCLLRLPTMITEAQLYILCQLELRKNFPGRVGVIGLAESKAHLTLLEGELGLSLAITNIIEYDLKYSIDMVISINIQQLQNNLLSCFLKMLNIYKQFHELMLRIFKTTGKKMKLIIMYSYHQREQYLHYCSIYTFENTSFCDYSF